MEAIKSSSDYKYIVGIGASAGGLEALQKLLNALPANTGFPYIIVQHLSPDYKSLLSEILGKYTDMPVIQAEDGMRIEADHVYIIQPGKNMQISGNELHMTDQIPKELNLPIDIFFRSLAEEAKKRAIAIVLSGTGSDGTNGIKAIKENDGMVIVQDIASSKFDGMPRSAMRTGLVDAQISPEEIALELEHISDKATEPSHDMTEKEIDVEQMKRVYAILKKVSNINFTHYKPTTIIRRMERRMMLTHKDTLIDYVDYLYESPEEVRILSKEVLIGVTNFFRDPEFFQCLKEKVITDIVNHSTPDEPIRVWVAGCSTGEEAYSVAILITEVIETLKVKRAVKIFATDLDAESISIAAKGVYGDNIIDSVSAIRLSRYFTRHNNTYTINRDIRKMIVFSPHNVFQDPPFGRLDLISCRNMLIYFQPVLQNDLFAIFHQALKDGGYLFLGKSEAIGAYTEAFPVVDAVSKIFAHRADAKIQGAKKVPYLQTSYLDDEYIADTDDSFQRSLSREETDEIDVINNKLFEKFMPATLVVNEKNELVHSLGDNSNFVHLALGKYSNSLFDFITDGLKIPVSTLLKESREKQKEIQYKDIHFKGERSNTVIDLTVMPVSKRKGDSSNLFALVFDDRGIREEADVSIPYDIDKVASQRITDLEQNLSDVQGKLDRSVAEQECVNEELQAANEELLTANEELQSSNEELQSVNEELYTVNSEYQQKLTELADLNDDIANFLTCTLTGIIFVDNKLNIRRYTDYVTTEFSVMDHDIGRSLAFISYHFPSIDITEICTNVLKTLIPDEREVATNQNKVFFMRVAPYRSTENKIMGCVITFMDVTSQKLGQVTLLNTEKQLTMAQQASEAKSDYLSRIAHEIRTPMGSLISLAKAARQQAQGNPALNSKLVEIIDTVDYMTAIVTDISEASISERLAGEQVMEPFALRSVLNSITAIMEPRVEDAKVTFQLSLDDSFDPQYLGNKTKVQQILINFLNNSVKYTKEGGSISLRAFEESSQGDRVRVCFIVSDTGVGIKKEYIPRLFKPFTRENTGDGNAPVSMGLGLSISYNLIMSMDGDVSVESTEGQGSTFTIHVMLKRFTKKLDEQPDCYAVPAPKDYDLSGCNVLIAEDNALNRTILGAMLANEGMTFVEAADGEEVVQNFIDAPERTFDCILMDMRMPKLDGIRATAEIRGSGKSDAKLVPIIGVSANGFADDIQQARQSGIDEYVTKPIDRDALLSAMSKLIKRM
jgi:two-component system CheB/CheR fusion protein